MYNNYYPNQFYNQGAMPDMLNGYKQQYQMPVQTAPKPTNDMIWVQGEAGAKGYPVAPNSTVVLWDSENPTIYVKSADSTGIPTMRVLDFVERGGAAKTADTSNYVTSEQFNELKGKVDELAKRYESEEE